MLVLHVRKARLAKNSLPPCRHMLMLGSFACLALLFALVIAQVRSPKCFRDVVAGVDFLARLMLVKVWC